MRKVDDTYCCHFDRISRLPAVVVAADLRSANDAVSLILARAGARLSGG